MIGRRRPKGVFSRSEIAPTIGGIVIAKSPPTLTARPIAVPWLALGTTASIWFWMTTVVSGCQRKKLPNQNALSAVCLRFPNRVVPGARAAAELTAQGYLVRAGGTDQREVAYIGLLRRFSLQPEKR